MKRNETFRKEVMALEFDRDYNWKYIKGLVTEYLITFITEEVQLELRRLDIPLVEVVEEITSQLFDSGAELVDLEMVEEYYINFLLSGLKVEDKRKMLMNSNFTSGTIRLCPKDDKLYKRYVKKLTDEEIEEIVSVYEFKYDYATGIREKVIKEK